MVGPHRNEYARAIDGTGQDAPSVAYEGQGEPADAARWQVFTSKSDRFRTADNDNSMASNGAELDDVLERVNETRAFLRTCLIMAAEALSCPSNPAADS